MLYRPEKGRVWDPTIIVRDGVFHLFTMYYEAGAPESYAMRLATSPDGVRWTDRGNVLTDALPVYKCGVFRLPDGRYSLNYGSLSGKPGHENDTLQYAVSDDLVHWTKLRRDHPDRRWYEAPARWDHMYCLPSEGGGYIGYVVATPKRAPDGGTGGMLGIQRSADGLTWSACPPPAIDWGDAEPTREMEIGGCERIGDKWYLMGGICPPYCGRYGYGCYVFEADGEAGPFRPCRALRLCGMNGLKNLIFRLTLPAFVREFDGGLLASQSVWYERDDPQNCNWVLPLRRVEVDADGLHLAYWEGNDALRGTPLPVADTDAVSRALPAYQLDDERALSPLADYDPDAGLFVEGVLTAEPNPPRQAVRAACWRPSRAGFAVGGAAVAVEVGDARYCHAYAGAYDPGRGFVPDDRDVSSPGDATAAHLDPGVPTPFRLLARLGVAELYLGGRLVHTFVMPAPGGALALLAENAHVRAADLRAWRMA